MLQRSRHRWVTAISAGVVAGGLSLWAGIEDLPVIDTLHDPAAEHVDQAELVAMVRAGQTHEAFIEAFEDGDELFEANFNALDGVGANVGQGFRFTRVPRADLDGPGQWARHVPARTTGPNAISCNACHIQLFDDGAGSVVANVHRDPLHSGEMRRFIQRNTPHVFALGALQRLAEEMTVELFGTRDTARDMACASGFSGPRRLTAKGINFGLISARRTSGAPCQVDYDYTFVIGVGNDLVVKPFQWKGVFASVRSFNRDAAHNELGMQPVETTGDGVDGDSDGVTDEMTVGDMTALAVYLAAQPRPTTRIELASLGVIDPLPADQLEQINRGRDRFERAGCATCHIPQLVIENPVFSEPSQLAAYRDARFPAGQNPVARGVDPAFPITFNLTRDQPDNQIEDDNGNVTFRLGAFRADPQGRAIVELFGDLKRHFMGLELAESIDEQGTGAATFLTENLWGAGSTAPYLHDGRATTLTEAILAHGGEARPSRQDFLRLSQADQKAVLMFIENLVLFKFDEVEEVVTVPPPEPAPVTSPFVRQSRQR